MPSDFYAQLIARATKKGVKTLLDTDGEALSQGVEAGPTIVTPNQQEAERLLNTVLLTRSHSLAAARRILSMGAERLCLSLGSRGAIGAASAKPLDVGSHAAARGRDFAHRRRRCTGRRAGLVAREWR